MDWFLYDGDLRHERVVSPFQARVSLFKFPFLGHVKKEHWSEIGLGLENFKILAENILLLHRSLVFKVCKFLKFTPSEFSF